MFIRTSAVKTITFGFASAITLFPWVLIGKQTRLNRRLVVHERIHLKQQGEMLILPFYVWYGTEYLIRLLHYKNSYLAYKNISFEREAYYHDHDIHYLSKRPLWNWRHFIFNHRQRSGAALTF